jgi:hypothetical protein
MACAYNATIFIPIPIEYEMMALNTPMVSIELEHLFSVGAYRRVAGQSVSNFVGFFAAFFVDGVALYGKYLTDKRKFKVVVQYSRCPNRA